MRRETILKGLDRVRRSSSRRRPTGRRREGTVDPRDIDRFSTVADAWWDERGPFAPLHKMTPARMRVIRDRVTGAFDLDGNASKPFAGLEILDVGCGGGLLSEPMTRLGATVTGLDASDAGIDAAIGHARRIGLDIDYRVGRVEDLADAMPGRFDVIVASEVIEHVADPEVFMTALAALLRPRGLVIVTTINRTAASLALAKVAVEYLLGWVPRGTHDWRQFITPGELEGLFVRAGLDPEPPIGIVYRPLADEFDLSRDDSVNYAASATKP